MGTWTSEIQWPPRSPDLTPLDFYFWGYIKNEVYKEPLQNIEELKNKITHVCHNISKDVLKKVTSNEVKKRLEFCMTSNGQHFEHLIKYKN